MLARLKFELDDLANEIVDQLPKSLFESKTTTFLDPSMGGGQFVRAIESKLREFGHSDSNIAKRVFGFERTLLEVKFVVNKYKLVGNYNAVKYESFLEADLGMKFDVVIGNPPYQSTDSSGARKSMSTNLWSKFTIKSIEEIIIDGGIVALVTPSSWASNTVDIIQGKIKLFSDVFVKYNPISLNTQTVANYFPGVGSTFSYFIIEKKPNTGSTVLMDSNGNKLEIDSRNMESLPKIISKETMEINKKFTKLMSNNETCQGQLQSKSCLYNSEKNDDFMYPAYHTLSVASSGNSWYTNVPHPNMDKDKIIFSLSGYYEAVPDNGKIGYTDMCLAYILEDGELLSAAEQVFGSKLFKFFINNNKWSGFNPKEIIRSFPKLDLSREWTDIEIYEYFGLTQEEIDFIEQN